MSSPSFEEFAHFIRNFSGHSSKKTITPETLFEKDLGITGDDGSDLLIATEKQFDISLVNEEGDLRSVFGLGPNEYLFNSEGWGFPPLWWLGIGNKLIIHEFTVGELYDAVCRASLR